MPASRASNGPSLVGQKAVHVEFPGNAGGRVGAASIVATGADVDLAVGDGRHGEFDGVSGPIAIPSGLGTIPQFSCEIRGVIGMENRDAAAGRLRRAVQRVLQGPDDGVRCSVGRKRRSCAGETVAGSGLRERRTAELAGRRIEDKLLETAYTGNVEIVLPENRRGKDGISEIDGFND